PYYNWHRYADPSIGRYMRADPVGADQARGLTPFAYVGNSPLRFEDPMGLFEICASLGDPVGTEPIGGPYNVGFPECGKPGGCGTSGCTACKFHDCYVID